MFTTFKVFVFAIPLPLTRTHTVKIVARRRICCVVFFRLINFDLYAVVGKYISLNTKKKKKTRTETERENLHVNKYVIYDNKNINL